MKQNPFVMISEMSPTAIFGFTVICIYIFVAIFAPVLAPFGESEIVGPQYEPWSRSNLLGTDNLGRDMLTRVLYGARNTIGIAALTTVLAFALGMSLGFLAATVGGMLDTVISRFVDVLMAIPMLIFALMLLTVFGSSTFVLVLVIGFLESTRVFRVSRALAMNIVVLDFVEQANLRGEGLGWIMFHEILPNTVPALSAEFGLRFSFVFLFISALSFLGIGLQPPTADWGSMVRDNATLLGFGDLTPLIPATAIAVFTIAINFLVDWFLHRASGLKEV